MIKGKHMNFTINSGKERMLYNLLNESIGAATAILATSMIPLYFILSIVLINLNEYSRIDYTEYISGRMFWTIGFGGLFLVLLSGRMFVLISKFYGKNLAKQKRSLGTTLKKQEDINEIIYILSNISKTVKRMFLLKNILGFIMRREYILRLNNYFLDEIQIMLAIYSNLRSDLQLRLAEQQKTLEQAKSEVEENIKGTSELNQVSELQQARLDRQIEQFEELQRVLVKA